MSKRAQRVWFHGTNYRTALKIEKEGFRAGTYFARHMEDAVEFGGPCIFWVRVQFVSTPLRWQVCSANKIPASAIWKRVDVVRKREAGRGRPMTEHGFKEGK